MGFVLDFDARNNILRVTIKDRFTDEIMRDIYAAITKYVASHRCRGIVDFSKVTTFEASNDAIRTLAESDPAFPAGCVRIFVCPEDLIYGMARMFQILGEKTRPDLHVARTLDEAYHWLKADAPEFGPVS
jgi:hypothetical protein